jgi:hypothetical protein
MTGDQKPNGKPEEAGKAESDAERARRSARKLLKELDGPVDEDFKQSLAGLSQQLGKRVAGQSANDPRATAEARKAALHAYDVERAHKLKTILKAAGGAALTVSITGLVVLIASPFDHSPPPRATMAPAKPVEVVAVAPIPEPAKDVPPAIVPPAIVPVVAQASLSPVPTPSQTHPPEVEKALPEPSGLSEASGLEEPPLRRDEVRDIQVRLRAFGFNPGPLDGVAGPATHAAILHYQQKRELPQTGTIDRQLLEQLRQDPAPQVVAPQVAQRPAKVVRASSASRPSDPFEPLRTAAQDFERWLQSLGR